MNLVEFDKESNMYIFKCPHCDQFIIVHVTELNCKIFRHGCYKFNGVQVDPHASEQMCNILKNSDKVIGCCNPFQIVCVDDKLYAIKCGYI